MRGLVASRTSMSVSWLWLSAQMFSVERMWCRQIRMSLLSSKYHMSNGSVKWTGEQVVSLVRIVTTIVRLCCPCGVARLGRGAEIGGIRSLTARLVVAFLSWVANGRQSTKACGLESEGLRLAPLSVRSR
jgi:hypothetical protein